MKMRKKINGKAWYTPERISSGIDGGPHQFIYGELSENPDLDFLQILARIYEKGRRLGAVELANHLGVSEEEFDRNDFLDGKRLDFSPTFSGEDRFSLQNLSDNEMQDLGELGIYFPVASEIQRVRIKKLLSRTAFHRVSCDCHSHSA